MKCIDQGSEDYINVLFMENAKYFIKIRNIYQPISANKQKLSLNNLK